MLLDPYRFGVAGSGSLDPYLSGLWAAYGDRRMISSYAGDAMRVRRASDDAEADIGFSADDLDVAALESFCAGTSGYVVTEFDQSGNGNDDTQATANRQRIIVSAGTYLGWHASDGSNDVSATGVSSGSNSTLSVFLAIDIPSISSTVDAIFDFGDVDVSAGAEIWTFGPTTRWNVTITGSGGIAGGTGPYVINEYAGSLTTGPVVVAGIFDSDGVGAAKAKIFLDGVAPTLSNTAINGGITGPFPARSHYIGARNASAAQPAAVRYKRRVIYESDRSADVISISALLA